MTDVLFFFDVYAELLSIDKKNNQQLMCVRKELMGHIKKNSCVKKIEKFQSQHHPVPFHFITVWQEFEPLNRLQCLVMIVHPSSC